jgi:hypothetical protein
MRSCAFCHSGKVRRTAEEMRFRQWSDKGYIHCHVVVTVDVCRGCGFRTLDEDAEKVMNAAFQREYRKVAASAAAVLGCPYAH